MQCGKPTCGSVKKSSSFGSRELAFLDLLREPPLKEAIQQSDHRLPYPFFLYRQCQEIRFDFFCA